MCDELEPYIMEVDKDAYSQKLSQTEDWLYEDGEDCEKAVYEEKLKELKMIGEATKKRKSEYEGRKAAADALGHSLQMANKVPLGQFESPMSLVWFVETIDFKNMIIVSF